MKWAAEQSVDRYCAQLCTPESRGEILHRESSIEEKGFDVAVEFTAVCAKIVLTCVYFANWTTRQIVD